MLFLINLTSPYACPPVSVFKSTFSFSKLQILLTLSFQPVLTLMFKGFNGNCHSSEVTITTYYDLSDNSKLKLLEICLET